MTTADPTDPDSDPVWIEIDRGEVTWRFDGDFLASNWTCIFGAGCRGILDRPADELHQGCCSLGAHFGDGEAGREEAMQISAMAALLTPEQWQYHHVGTDGIFGDEARSCTAVVDGACVFLNRPHFARGPGCALHVAALDADERPLDWKPSVCWQLPLYVDWAPIDPDDPFGPETATVRRWGRTQWGDHGRTMAWACTERADGGEAYVGESPVVESLADELREIIRDDAVLVELRRRVTHRS
ncbi:MAG: hypothetical protein AAF945_05755 [Actinomycetota bacterium]